MKHGKKYNESVKLIEKGKLYDLEEAVEVAVKTGSAKFDETDEVHDIRYSSPVADGMRSDGGERRAQRFWCAKR